MARVCGAERRFEALDEVGGSHPSTPIARTVHRARVDAETYGIALRRIIHRDAPPRRYRAERGDHLREA
jgi:hypothetical protein